MSLTVKGITIFDRNGNSKWSTPKLESQVNKLVLTDMGNLVLLGQNNVSVWESFHHPTDTIVIGQSLSVGTSLSSSVSNSNFSTGNYKLIITSSDAILQWYGQTYWKLSMDSKAYKNSNYSVEYMTVNTTGFYVFGYDEKVLVYQIGLSVSNFHVVKLDFNGQFTISSFSGTNLKQEFVGPDDGCQIPLACGRVGLCTDNTLSSSPLCSCPPNFHVASGNVGGCVPNDGSNSLPLACTNNHSESNSSDVSFLIIGYGVGYFGNIYSDPFMYGVNLSVCQGFCLSNCSCLGILYRNSSRSCFMIENELGSISNKGEEDMLGLIKVNILTNNKKNSQKERFPVIAAVLLPIVGMILVMAVFLLIWRKFRKSKNQDVKLGKSISISHSSGDLDHEAFYIPGLPSRFDYEELEVATENFKTLIGSGAFGVVYKGVLPDNNIVAVKKIMNIGVQGKKDFFTEIAVIGNIHHVNLVRLKGFCAQRGHRMLVYEYMNRGSLDRNLFGNGPVLEWQERLDVALGTARGLAYLHSGCDQKIIHCDIKPENILLHDQFQAKISDFGLSKLLSPQQSGLFTTMRGTRGYLAPEWLTNSAISEKTDVYSFGMVLLELVSGRKNCSFRSRSRSRHSNMDENNSTNNSGNSSNSSATGLVYFPLYALEMHEQRSYMDLADPRLEGRVTFDEVEKLVRIALCCVHEEPTLRPNMVSVVGMLEGGTSLPQPRMESLHFLRFYGRRFSEASVIEEDNENGSVIMIQQQPRDSTPIISAFSYISSQNISGPR